MHDIQNYLEEVKLYLREINTISIIIRLTLATICGGILGAERGRKKRKGKKGRRNRGGTIRRERQR